VKQVVVKQLKSLNISLKKRWTRIKWSLSRSLEESQLLRLHSVLHRKQEQQSELKLDTVSDSKKRWIKSTRNYSTWLMECYSEKQSLIRIYPGSQWSSSMKHTKEQLTQICSCNYAVIWLDLICFSLSISAMLKALSKRRENNLKIIIMSATIETEKFARFFDTQNIVYLQGRCHPIEVFYCR